MSATLALKKRQMSKKRASFSSLDYASTDDNTNSLVNLVKETQRCTNNKRRKSCSDALDLSSIFSSISKENDELQFPSIDFGDLDFAAVDQEATGFETSTKTSVFTGYRRVGGLVRSKPFSVPRAA